MPRPLRIAYLTGEYPAVSHTFILREVLALRRLGVEVTTCSIRRTGPEHHRGPDERQAAATTFNVIDAAKNPRTGLAALFWSLARPRRLGRTIRLALATRPAGVKATVWQAFYLLEAMVLARHLARQGVDRIHNHFAMASSSVAMLASELGGIPYGFTLHGPADFQDTGRWRLDVKIAGATYMACISRFARSQACCIPAPSIRTSCKSSIAGWSPTATAPTRTAPPAAMSCSSAAWPPPRAFRCCWKPLPAPAPPFPTPA